MNALFAFRETRGPHCLRSIALRVIRALCLPLMFTGWLSLPVSAVAEQLLPDVSVADWLVERVVRKWEDITRDKVRDAVLEQLREFDVDANGLDAADEEARAVLAYATWRADRVARNFKYDLDADGVITSAEVTTVIGRELDEAARSSGAMLPTADLSRKSLDMRVADIMKGDRNRDGRLTLTEMYQAAMTEVGGIVSTREPYYNLPPASLDLNGDGVVTLAEATTAVEHAFDSLDKDGDGKLDEAEIAAVREKAAEATDRALQKFGERQAEEDRTRQMRKMCDARLAAPDETVVLYGAFLGAALSTVALGDETTVTTSAEVLIEPGTTPLYVVLTSGSAMVWRFSGATERVRQVLMWSSAGSELGQRVAVTGVKAEVVRQPGSSCAIPLLTGRDQKEAAPAASAVRRIVGKPADVLEGAVTAGQIAFPSGRQTGPARAPGVAENGPAAGLWSEVLKITPGGVVEIDARTAVGSAPVVPYSVLPGQAGLARLVEDGTLIVTGYGARLTGPGTPDVYFGPGETSPLLTNPAFTVTRVPAEFRIVRPMQMPVALAGTNRVRFTLGRDVPPPKGDLAGLCIISEETGAPIEGSGC